MEATKLLKRDHARVKMLFARYAEQGERALQTKQEIFDQLQAEVDVHTRIEEEIFYPFVKGLRSAELRDLVAESVEEHAVLKRLLDEIRSSSPEKEEFDAKMKVLEENLLHHAEEEEEGKMFPLFIQTVDVAERNELGRKLEARKDSLQAGWKGWVADWLNTLNPLTE